MVLVVQFGTLNLIGDGENFVGTLFEVWSRAPTNGSVYIRTWRGKKPDKFTVDLSRVL